MIVLTFHTRTPTWENSPHPIGGSKPLATHLIPIFTKSIRTTNPDASLCLITDETSCFNEDFDKTYRFAIDQDRLMLDRLACQIAVIEELCASERVCLLDTDIIVLDKLNKIFDGNFDVAVTIRDKPKFRFEHNMPYNNGVIFIDLRNKDLVLIYLNEIRKRIESMPTDYHAWSGNQFAVRDILGKQKPFTSVEVGETQVLILPCSYYNYTPSSLDDNLDEVNILHFRGDAKDLMPQFAQKLNLEKIDH